MAFNWFKRLLKNQSSTQALDLNTQTLKQTSTHASTQADKPVSIDSESEKSSIGFEKESLQLGLAAGYTGRSIHDIHSSLARIETLMPSKDWMLIQLDEHFREHEENEKRRLETLLHALNSLHSISLEAPEPVKTKLLDKITVAESSLGLSNRMKELVQIVKYYNEINYFDLAQKMNLTESGLRSLLTMTFRRTSELEKFDRDNRKWLRYKQNGALSVQTSVPTTENQPSTQTTPKNEV